MSKTITIDNNHELVQMFQDADNTPFREQAIYISGLAYGELTKLFQQAESGTTFEFASGEIRKEAENHFKIIQDDEDYPELQEKKFTFKLME